ncbi:ADAMTS-like protein 1 isoform X7 [Daphnia pulex]|uniref:ADAMTS-like protein 1 isoform X7 n=1 Tax=Daphnia pulex TaxID=6669 RepID=UPI001EDF9603|nr:ADAMTS-like protein 1 isoform X7 [Daphnia pulex]
MDTSTTTRFVYLLVVTLAVMDQGGPSFLCRADDFGADQETRDPHEPQWSTWSEWAPCSRTCDGGATYQTRRCMDMVRGCGIHERSIRYQICNMQPCPEMVDFRLQQCQNYNSIPYQGKLYNWVPLTDKSTPACSLSCRAVNTSLIVQHAARVHDGTRCKPGSLDMCIDGICQPVGCDLQLNSDSKVDACGVCGGDGSTCLDSTSDDLVIGYRWEFGHRLSPCTASCDGGQQEVEIICRDAVTGLEVSDQNLCDESSRPQPKFVQCHTDPCPPKWIVGSWESCSVTCGGGVKERRVYCQQGHNNSRVDDVICSALIGHKARTHEPCNTHDCPNWFQGPWSQCSTRCGDDGVQTRVVVCRDARGHVTNACRLQDQPPTSRSCPSQPPCPSTEPPPTTVTAPNRPPREKVTPFNLFDDDEIEEEEEEEEKQLKGVLVQQPSGSVSSSSGSAPSALLSEKLQVGEISLVPTDPTLALYYACGWFYKSFIAGEWSPCSVTCGDGTREREVNCKIFLEFSKTIAKLPDKECPGLKPAEVEPCFMRPCSLSNKYEPWIDQFSDQSNYKLMLGTRKPVEDLRAATKMELTSGSSSSSSSGSSSSGGGPVTVTKPSYAVPPSSVTAPLLAHSWKSSGFSQCSASCLGGVQESIIECIREQDGQRVGPHLCPMERRPDAITRTCNDVPCPPRWNTSDFSSCSRTCGGGVQTRDVHCIHEVARGGGNTLPVGADLCPQPPPRAQQYCNMIDCPVEWKTGEWSQCSSTCDGGFKVRKVSCQQILALGQVLTKTANHCNPTSRPAESKPCNTGKTCSSSGSKAEGKEADDLGGQEEEEQVGGVTTTAGSVPERPPPSGPAPSPAAASDLPKIQSTNQNFVQQGQSKKKVTLKIGGKATVFKGTQIKIRCPVKHFDKSKISWMKDHILLVKNPKHELNKKGMLRIRDATFSDSGVYSCIAGRSVANITVTVRPAPTTPNNPDSDWESPSSPVAGGNRSKVDGHVKQQQRVQQTLTDELSQRPGSSSGGGGGGSSWAAGSSNPAAGGWEDEEEEEEEDDVIKEMKGNSLANGHAGQIKNNFDHRFKSAGRPDQTFVSGSTGPHFSDQDQQQPEQSPSSSKKNSKPSGSSSSSSGRHNSQRSKLRNASPGHHQQKMGGAKKSVSDPATSSSSVISAKEKGKADSLKFEWLLTPWSKCSQTCGGSGFQVRAVQCIVRHNNVTKSVEASLCEDAGLANPDTADATKPSTLASSSNNNRQPATVQKCGLDTCPHWVAGSWTPCHQSRCFTWNTALQKRQLDCVMDNGTLLDAILCSDRDRPSQKRECFNENCRGAWKVSDWSHCSATCDSVGHQSRLLRCVWYGTESPAGMACAELPRLPVTRPCRGPPCPQRGQCRDQSSYCGLVQTLELCYIPRYRQHCCQTCQNAQPPIPTKPADKKETDHLSRTLANDKNKKSNNNNNKKKKNHHHKKVPTDKKQPPPPPTTSHLS